MGNFNSGRSGGTATKERTGAVPLDVNRIVRALDGRTSATLGWQGSFGGAFVVIALTVALDPDDDRGTVRVRHAAFAHLTEEVPAADYTVRLVAEPCRYGGRRWFLFCPRTGRRCAKLFLPNGGHCFLSRHAYRLGYQSQRGTALDRAHGRLARLHRKLGADYDGPLGDEPPRPKGMRRATYERLLGELGAAGERLDVAWLTGSARLLKLLRK